MKTKNQFEHDYGFFGKNFYFETKYKIKSRAQWNGNIPANTDFVISQ